MLQYGGFIFFDDGIGISQNPNKNNIAPIDAFFSIGLSTKTMGESIGYKCQGSKLCFACGQFALITKCASEDEYWRSVVVDNPRDNLSDESSGIEVDIDKSPLDTLKSLLSQPDVRTRPILDDLEELFQTNSFECGTLILVKKLEVEHFSRYYGTDVEYPYIITYIKHCTKHGDVRILKPDQKGFSVEAEQSFRRSSQSYNDQCSLFIWDYKSNIRREIENGYPYINRPDDIPELDGISVKKPSELKYLRSGRYFSRRAQTFRHDGQIYCLILAIDGLRSALDFHEDLGRQGSTKSGITLSSQQGTFLCAEGIKVCDFNNIFQNEILEDRYSVLTSAKAQKNFVFMINGSFPLVTNRNSLSVTSDSVFEDTKFLNQIRKFLDIFYGQNEIFRDLIDTLNNQINSSKIEIQIKQFNESKNTIPKRDRFYVKNIPHLDKKRFYIPSKGEEHGVGSLYTLFAHLVPDDSPYKQYWLRPLNFAGQGLDSISENDEMFLKGLEYKYRFSIDDVFNHPLIVTDQIVCWELNVEPDEKDFFVRDEADYQGRIVFVDHMKDFGFEIQDIEGRNGQFHNSNIRVICLEKLLKKTFSCTWRPGFLGGKKSKKVK